MFNWLTSKTHPIPIPNAEDFSLKPIYPASFGLKQLDLLETIGTGSFGRVRLVKNIENNAYHALKILKKAKIVRLNQVRLYLHHASCSPV
jgi:serine/threonine protein kinase